MVRRRRGALRHCGTTREQGRRQPSVDLRQGGQVN